jgi:hypothetical protein
VLDEIATRTKYLNFENFQVWVIIILDKGSKYIFVRSKGSVLLKTYFDLGMFCELNSNFGHILNRVRERILESYD